MPIGLVQQEGMVTNAAQAAGLPVARSYEVVEIGDKWGIVFENVDGRSLLQYVSRKPWKSLLAAHILAELHARIHNCPATVTLPSQREQIKGWINCAVEVPDTDRIQALQQLYELPTGTSLCHGDFHPDNILLHAQGPVIIDWITGSSGNPLADVAWTVLLLDTAILPPDTPRAHRWLLNCLRHYVTAAYLKRYLQLRPGTQGDIEIWKRPLRIALSGWRSLILTRPSL